MIVPTRRPGRGLLSLRGLVAAYGCDAAFLGKVGKGAGDQRVRIRWGARARFSH